MEPQTHEPQAACSPGLMLPKLPRWEEQALNMLPRDCPSILSSKHRPLGQTKKLKPKKESNLVRII